METPNLNIQGQELVDQEGMKVKVNLMRSHLNLAMKMQKVRLKG